MNERPPWNNGFDAGLNGPNKTNCHFSNFQTEQDRKDWEEGNRAGKKAKLEKDFDAVKERKLESGKKW